MDSSTDVIEPRQTRPMVIRALRMLATKVDTIAAQEARQHSALRARARRGLSMCSAEHTAQWKTSIKALIAA